MCIRDRPRGGGRIRAIVDLDQGAFGRVETLRGCPVPDDSDACSHDEDAAPVALHPTDRLELFLRPPRLTLGPPFRDLGRITLQDQDYRHYRLEDLLPGRTVEVPLPVPRPLRWALKWATLALVPAVLITVLALARAPAPGGAPTAAERTRLELRRRELLAELSPLDPGRGDPAEHDKTSRRRQLILAEAVDVYRRLGLDR